MPTARSQAAACRQPPPKNSDTQVWCAPACKPLGTQRRQRVTNLGQTATFSQQLGSQDPGVGDDLPAVGQLVAKLSARRDRTPAEDAALKALGRLAGRADLTWRALYARTRARECLPGHVHNTNLNPDTCSLSHKPNSLFWLVIVVYDIQTVSQNLSHLADVSGCNMLRSCCGCP